ncbi:3-deoxy-D-manno-octulosonate 8-phosphate phosphatase [Cystobacter fuscus DSM 2262]|uniref:3-deoxy-D-manno-octulosonate 8-phosphate phosphatase n=1 Tax=Cystobacter fuscus (strain ATCC 25194 / DSM 2262 / NBRC 100088 / M29) TaxID=1242864 RepID=S9Q979_CYSF2|nr:HAD hydrolase family protein [Cystobacter fuscus]EPX57909.1 3-deoxy-D-manno-octulosonate 8-phosphate phosphatase [Cystobacter fuscus DSM 2262]
MNQDLESLKARVSQLSVMIFDIDGTLTDGRIFWVPNSGWTQMYSVRDGMGIKRLQEVGMEVAAISGGDSLSAQMRMQSLGIKHVHFGSQDKVAHFETLLELLEVTPERCGYMGDELVDLPLLQAVGFSAAPPEAPDEVRSRVHYVAQRAAGFGAAREVCEFILRHRRVP